MNSRSALRLAIVFLWLSIILAVSLSLVFESKLPDQLQAYLAWDLERELTTLEMAALIVGLVSITIGFISSVALFRFKSWGKVPFVVAAAVGLAASPFLGHTIQHAYVTVFDSLESVFLGFVVALIFFTDAVQNSPGDG